MHRSRIASAAACLALAWLAAPAAAQQPAPQPPAFAPANLTTAGVRALAGNCAACHGVDGRPAAGGGAADLAIAGMPRGTFVAKMKQFQEGKRPATVMHQVVKGYNEAEIAALGEYFAGIRP